MYNHLLLHKFKFSVVGPVPQENLNKAECFFKKQGYKVTRILPPPSREVLEWWKDKSEAEATDGCKVVGLRSCLHGHRSWLAVEKELDNKEVFQ